MGEIKMVGFNFAPRGYAFCYGQLAAISENQALYALLGTIYWGDGRISMGIPDLRGRTAVGTGAGPGLTSYPLGTRYGYETLTLQLGQLPAHSHTLMASKGAGNNSNPDGGVLAAVEAATFSGEVAAGIPVEGNVRGTALSDGKTSEARAISGSVASLPYTNAAPDTQMGSTAIASTGSGDRIENRSPLLAIHYIICLDGLFPSRN
ncbi:MAG: tail fiber protein [Deltaproteobacteria bacterium]|nr:tail fiber protein [Deltaproteobacteria bacterium]